MKKKNTMTEAPLYLVPNNDGTGKRLVRRPHPPPTTAPLPDDFDAITETRDGTTVYDDATNSALEIDYDDITLAPIFTLPSTPIQAPMPTPALVSMPTSPPRNLTSTPRQRRAGSPSHSIAGFSSDMRGSRRAGDSHGTSKARSVAGGDRERERDRDRTGQRRSLGAGNALMPSSPMPPPLSFPSGKGPAKGRNDLVEKLVLEDGPERTISVWREHVAKRASEAGRGGGGGGGGANAAGGDDGVPGGTGGEGRSDLDSHVGRRRVSTDSRRRVESLAQGSASGSPSLKGKGHRSRESAEFTEVSRRIPLSPFSKYYDAEKLFGRISQDLALCIAVYLTSGVRDAAGGRQRQQCSLFPAHNPTEIPTPRANFAIGQWRSKRTYRVQWVYIGRRVDQSRVRSRNQVKEEALKKGVTVVEWAILIDKLQSL